MRTTENHTPKNRRNQGPGTVFSQIAYTLEFFPPMNCFLGWKLKPLLSSIQELLVLDLSYAICTITIFQKKKKSTLHFLFLSCTFNIFQKNNHAFSHSAFSHEYIFFFLLLSNQGVHWNLSGLILYKGLCVMMCLLNGDYSIIRNKRRPYDY